MSARAPEPGRGFRGSRRAAPRAGALNRASRARRDQHCSGAPVSTAPVVVLTGAAQWRDPASAVSRSSTGLRPMAGGSAADPRLDLVQKMRPSRDSWGADVPDVPDVGADVPDLGPMCRIVGLSVCRIVGLEGEGAEILSPNCNIPYSQGASRWELFRPL